MGEYLAEVVVPGGWSAADICIRDIEQCPILLVLTEVIYAPWYVIAELPVAYAIVIGDAEERVEGSRLEARTTRSGIIGRWDQRTANACEAVTHRRILDARQIRLESKAAVLHIIGASRQWTAEADRRWT